MDSYIMKILTPELTIKKLFKGTPAAVIVSGNQDIPGDIFEI